MTQSMLFSTVLCALIVLQLTTTTVTTQWKPCFDASCPFKNLDFSSKFSSPCNRGLSCALTRNDYETVNALTFKLKVDKSIDDAGRPIEIAFTNGVSGVAYTCGGPLITTTANNYIYPVLNGTAIYLNGKVYCSWSIDINNSSFPFQLIDEPQLYISEDGYQIYYNLNQTVPVAAADYSKLPASVEPFVDGYQYKAVGSEKYLLIAREANKTIDFLLKVNGKTPRLVEVNLKSDISIDIECDFKTKFVTGYSKINMVKHNLCSQIRDAKITGNECRWSLPKSFDGYHGLVTLKETVYELQIIENNIFTHFDENNFRIA